MSNLDLVNWTMQEARQPSPEHHMHSDIEGSSSLNNLLPGVLEGERGGPNLEGVRPTSALLKAIVEPDIYTAPADRERSNVLRWLLRDIKADRLKLSPVDQHYLRDLIGMGLVEMRNDVPVLTNAGVSAIV